VALAPTAVAAWRLRALVHVVLEDADAAVADAEMVAKLSSPGDPDALNHRAYIRAVLGRELSEALADIDRALEGDGSPPAEMLDTRGFILHLLGRHREAVDLLTEAITGMQQQRRKLGLLSGRADPDALACRLRAIEQGLAVMLHHRGQACRAIGLDEQAEQDFREAERKGFDPTRGIF
jgi:tetratricopeptide (TPR) repeat protein